MSLLTPQQLRELNTQIKPKYEKGLALYLPRWDWKEIADKDKCSQGEVILHWLDQCPGIQDWTNVSKEITNFSERGMRIRIRDQSIVAGLKLKELERGNSRNLRISLQYVSNGAAKAYHDLVASALINGGISVSPSHPKPDTYLGYDGKGLFGDHPINPDLDLTAKITLPVSDAKVLNTQSNLVTAAAMSPAAVAKVRQAARNFRDPRGRNLGVEINTFIVPPQLAEATYEAIGAKLIATFPNATSGATKENVNATISYFSNGQMVMVVPELDVGTVASQTSWYGCDRMHSLGKPFQIMEEKPLTFGTNLGQVAAQAETQGIMTEEVLFSATGRMTGYATLWFLIVKATS